MVPAPTSAAPVMSGLVLNSGKFPLLWELGELCELGDTTPPVRWTTPITFALAVRVRHHPAGVVSRRGPAGITGLPGPAAVRRSPGRGGATARLSWQLELVSDRNDAVFVGNQLANRMA